MPPASIQLSFDRGTLLLEGIPDWPGWTWDDRVGRLRTHAIEYAQARNQLLSRFGAAFADRVRVPPRVAWPKTDLPTLRKEQDATLAAWESSGGRGLVVMPTGTGKTEVALAAMARTRVATLIVAPVRDLMHQWHRRILRALGYDSGIVGERVIIFAGSNAMARDVSRRFLVPTLLAHSRKKERREVLEGFAAGKFPVLVANQVLDEGVDVPAAKVAVVIGGMASNRQATQRLGRILRRTGDARAVLYEVVVGDTREEERSRKRRRSEAYGATKRWKKSP